MERYIDAQIDHYLKNIRVRLLRMKVGYSTAQETIDEAAASPKKDLALAQRRRWKNGLKQLADAANGLRSMIETVLLGGLEGKGDLKPKVGPGGKATAFASEMKFSRGRDRVGRTTDTCLFLCTNPHGGGQRDSKSEYAGPFVPRARDGQEGEEGTLI